MALPAAVIWLRGAFCVAILGVRAGMILCPSAFFLVQIHFLSGSIHE
jgi:hypothetical protein